ncbi:MAG TPA: hypothetical protein VMS37_18225, partial [Verrucomicrobiae bacterium]|nr:hypothetical protein [Verrucomicrobiae bacterium]
MDSRTHPICSASALRSRRVNVAHYALGTKLVAGAQTKSTPGTDGSGDLPHSQDLIGDPTLFTGIYALQKVDLFNLLSIPDATRALPSS